VQKTLSAFRALIIMMQIVMLGGIRSEKEFIYERKTHGKISFEFMMNAKLSS
jgi:hypothetical protein